MIAPDSRRARERRLYEAALLRCLYPALTAEQAGQLLDRAEQVMLLDGSTLAVALNR